ncbi:MAG TPA: DUF5916 domain-containing protein [Gemmatimonadales bacterium]|nr:DUF5916 domain-containing protein [Gemmatimonadales bacterium]
MGDLTTLVAFVFTLTSPGPGGQVDTTPKLSTRLMVRAARASSEIVLDGSLTDASWAVALPVSDFTQREPNEGAPATERTEVRVLYDDHALYIAARMWDRSPDSVRAQLARRDRISNSDRFLVFLDCYRDRRTGFYFGINAAGTLYDGTLYNDDWESDTWDGVWEGRVARDSLGWSAELRIPYSQLRFQREKSHRWGINFKREIARRNERDYLVRTPSNGSGFVSRFVDLVGIDEVTPPPRLELLPYVTTRAEYLSHEVEDPFNDGARLAAGLGGDLKVGIGSNLTLDATVNPDFGQVEVDPAVVNLSDVETFFEERRPFFVEGASIFNFGEGGANDFWGFNWASPLFLYSRRIGRAPQAELPDQYDYSNVPAGSNILGAAKLSGKTGSWSLGALNAVTSREQARFSLGQQQWQQEVEPLTYYGVYRAQKELSAGRHGLGFIGTLTARSFDEVHLRSELSSSATTIGLDGWTTLDPQGVWVISGWTGISRVGGTSERLRNLQENSVHYFQRADADHLGIDSNATSLGGYAARVSLNKQKGNWMFNSAVGVVDPGFEANDLGFQFRGDQINSHLMFGHKWTRPSRLFRSWRLNFAGFRSYNFGGDVTWTGLFLTGLYELRNFSTGRWFVAYNPKTLSDRRTRGGPLMVNQPGVEWEFNMDSDPNRRWVYGWGLHGNHYQRGWEESWTAWASLEWKPGARVSVRLEPQVERSRTSAQYVDTFDDPLASATYGHRYVFADLDQTTVSASVRLNWIFTPRLSLEMYAQPLLSSGRYTGFKELARPRSYEFNSYPDPGETADPERIVVDPDGPGPVTGHEIDDPDFSLASLRGNAVLRWEYFPGSTLFLVWTQTRSDTEPIGSFRTGRALNRLWGADADNIFMVKISYWWNP